MFDLVVLHGSLGLWDEVFLFGGLFIVVVGLLLLPRLSAMRKRARKSSQDTKSG